MSNGDKGICVRILEKEFRVACAKNQEQALFDAAVYLDKQMRMIRHSGKVIGLERIAVIAALNIAHELLTLKNSVIEPEQAFSERLKVLQDKIDSVLAKELLLVREQSIQPKEQLKEDFVENLTLNELEETV
ncbi:MAG: cell division protein ZapA [Proteobacteria bacterium]|nr:cell division protein ZapA [Pseudomonadota bacterium]